MEDPALTPSTNNIDEIARINQISLEDDLPQEEKERNARAILNITEEKPSEEAVAKAYKTLALKTHPDRYSNSEESTQATQKLNKAKDILEKPGKQENFADSLWGGLYWTQFAPHSSRDDEQRTQKMKAWVEHIRGILLTCSISIPNSELYELPSGTRRQILNFFSEPALFRSLQQFCLDKKYQDSAIREDIKNLQNWATKFFSDPYQDSAQSINPYYGKLGLKYEELETIHTGLLEMVNRYDFFRNKYRILFQEAVFTCFTTIEEKLASTLSQFKSTAQSDKPPVAYQNFMQFAAAFVGQKESVANFSEDELLDPATEEALIFLDNLVSKKNPQLFSRLVALANKLRAQLDPNAAFIYSETSLEKNLEKSKTMDDLCKNHAPLSVLNAQLAFCIFLIVGKYFKPTIDVALTEQFPKRNENLSFREKLAQPSSVIPPQLSCESVLIASYQKYYGNGYVFFRMFNSRTFIKELEGPNNAISSSNIKGKLEYLLTILQKTFTPRAQLTSFEEKQRPSTKSTPNHPPQIPQTFSNSNETNKNSGLAIFIPSLLFLLFAGFITMGTLAATGNFDAAAYLFDFLEHSTDSLIALFLPAAVFGVGFLYAIYVYQSPEQEASRNMVFDVKDWEARPSGSGVDQKMSYPSTFSKNPLKSTNQTDSNPNAKSQFAATL